MNALRAPRAPSVRPQWSALGSGLLALFLPGCAADVSLPEAGALGITKVELATPQCIPTDPDLIRVDTVARGLEVPWDVTFLPDGRALVTERPGRIRVIRADGVLEAEPWAVLDVYAEAEAGLLGIDHRSLPGGDIEVFVAGTVQNLGSNSVSRILRGIGRRVARSVNPERGHARYLELYRIREVGSRGGVPDVLVRGLPAAPIHAGGAVRLGPDGKLYLTSGEAGDPPQAQSLSTTRGKILRFEPDGSVPAGNPMEGSPIWALGIRNVQGLGWTGDGAVMLAIDHGPTGQEREEFRTDFDELNLVRPGSNLGWPFVAGASVGGSLASPIAEWTTAIAPAGMTIVEQPDGSWANSIFVTGLRGSTLERLAFRREESGLVVECRESLFHSTLGRLRLVRQAPDGTIWVGTSNRDHRSTPRPYSDVIVRLHPPGA